jgi:hypothetical protein
MTRDALLKCEIEVAFGATEAERYSTFKLPDPRVLLETASEILKVAATPIGACAMLSAACVAVLRDRLNIPAIAVAGDLIVDGTFAFRCTGPLPAGTATVEFQEWDGHCWIEVDNQICDLSIFRTAYALDDRSNLKRFVQTHFGEGRGAIVCHWNELSAGGMEYVPKYVLSDVQITGLLKGLQVATTRVA